MGEWRPDPEARHQLRYHDGSGWTEHVSDNGVVAGDPINPAGALPPGTAPGDEAAQAAKGRKFLTAGLITSAASLLFCPCVGSVAGGALAFAGQQTTPRARRSSLGKLPLLTYVLSAVGLVGWMAIFVIAGGTAPDDEKVASNPAATTTTTVSAPVAAPAAPEPTLPVPSGDAELLAAQHVAPENDPGGYNRDLFNYPAGGADSRGCYTRRRVLERDSTLPAQITFPGCQVLVGRWVDSYTGTAFENPADVSIDHLVALKEAYVSGAASWSPATMAAFANDLERPGALRVISGPGNASKGDKDPAEWKPPLQSAWPDYARSWLGVKIAYGLTADQVEVDALRAMLAPPPPTAPLPALQPAATPSPATTAAPSTTILPTTRPSTTMAPPPTAPATTTVYYPNCAAVRAAGKAPLLRGQPGYRRTRS